ncbi:hypothetical protein SY91_00517 [Burkholderia cenocepacia]|nr:hypothetical protein SY91_00517 [Burkholderia cenocepacia]
MTYKVLMVSRGEITLSAIPAYFSSRRMTVDFEP